MNSSPEQEPDQVHDWPNDQPGGLSAPSAPLDTNPESSPTYPADPWIGPSATPPELPSFLQIRQPPQQTRIPHLGHLLMLVPLLGIGFVFAVVFFSVGVHFHFFGVTSLQEAGTDIHFILLVEAVMYLFAFAGALLIFPAFWQKGLFAGLQWRGAIAERKFWLLATVALGCFVLATLDELLLPGPANAPIEKMISTPGAAWLMFGFGITVAPFFEEMFFRGFLLPAMCTASDWIAEKVNADTPIALSPSGRPQWPVGADMIAAISLLSVPTTFFIAFYWKSGHFAIEILPPYAVALLVFFLVLAFRRTHLSDTARPVDANGHPIWSVSSMVTASIFTSLPFAGIHAQQQGRSLGPFLLLIVVSLVLCAVRLKTRSLASSVLVHATYNFMLFTLMLIGTGGFRHLDKM